MSPSRATILLPCCLLVAACATTRRGDDDDDDAAGPEDCASGYDEDDDQLVDCFDPDCAADPGCVRSENCTNLIDDDGDLLVDCDDPSCAAEETCAPEPESNCADELDDDGDGDFDCDDTDCAASPACQDPDPVDVDCDALCDHEQQCVGASPGCLENCQCSVDELLAPAFSVSFYGCMIESSCSVFEDSTPCVSQADMSQSALADDLFETCQGRGDCAGLDCSYFRMFNDDTLETLDACLVRGDCFTCLEDAASACPGA